MKRERNKQILLSFLLLHFLCRAFLSSFDIHDNINEIILFLLSLAPPTKHFHQKTSEMILLFSCYCKKHINNVLFDGFQDQTKSFLLSLVIVSSRAFSIILSQSFVLDCKLILMLPTSHVKHTPQTWDWFNQETNFWFKTVINAAPINIIYATWCFISNSQDLTNKNNETFFINFTQNV